MRVLLVFLVVSAPLFLRGGEKAALFKAIEASDLAQAEAVLQGMKNKKDLDNWRQKGWTPLIRAVLKNDIPMVALLLEHGAWIEAWGKHKWRPLTAAARFGDLEMTKFLCEKGANANMEADRRWRALDSAIEYKHFEVAEYLIARTNLNEVTGIRLPLHRAAAFGFKDLVIKMIEHGVDPNLRMHTEETALEFAAAYDRAEIVALLLQYNPDPTALKRAMSQAKAHRDKKVFDLLKDYQQENP